MMELEDLVVFLHPTQVDDFMQDLEDQGAIVLDSHTWPRLVMFNQHTPWNAEIVSVALELIYHLDD